MSCERFGPAIAAHAAGAALEPAAERHLGGCAACRQLLDTQQQMLAELDGEIARSLSISASPDFAARVVRDARNAAAPAPRGIPAPVWAGLGLAAAIVLAVWIRPAPVGDAGRGPDAGNRPAAPAPTKDVPLTADAAPTQGRLTHTQEKPAVRPTRSRSVVGSGSTVGTARSRPGATVGPGSLDPGRQNPPVIVDPERRLAIERLRELMIQRRLDEKMLPPPVTPEAAFAELTVAPLEIAEIRVPDVEIASRPPAAPQRQ